MPLLALTGVQMGSSVTHYILPDFLKADSHAQKVETRKHVTEAIKMLPCVRTHQMVILNFLCIHLLFN